MNQGVGTTARAVLLSLTIVGSLSARTAATDPGHSNAPGVGLSALLFAATSNAKGVVWAAGSGGPHLGSGVVLRWNGRAWINSLTQIVPGKQGESMLGISSRGRTAWAVGSAFASNGYFSPVADRWDGSNWNTTRLPRFNPDGDSQLNAVGQSSGIALAVGEYSPRGNASSTLPLVLAWDGDAWARQPVPYPAGNNQTSLSSLSVVSSDDAWAVGTTSRVGSSISHTLVVHWDGSVWSRVPSTNPSSTVNGLTSVVAFSGGQVWAVGSQVQNGGTRVLLERRVHGEMLDATLPQQFVTFGLTSIVGGSASDMWLVGSRSVHVGIDAVALHGGVGRTWSETNVVNQQQFNAFHAVTGGAGSPVWAVGEARTSERPLALMEYWTGIRWRMRS